MFCFNKRDTWGAHNTGSHAFRFKNNLIDTKLFLKDFNYNHFDKISTQISKIQAQLSVITRTRNNQAQDQIRELNDKLQFWYQAEENYWNQRNRDNDLRFEDKNTVYFH